MGLVSPAEGADPSSREGGDEMEKKPRPGYLGTLPFRLTN